MSKLPEGWVAAQLGDLLAAVVGGGTPSKSNADSFRGSIPFMTVKDMHERFISDTQDHITGEALENSASTLIPADTLVVATRMSLGKIARPKIPVAINQDLKALFPHDGLDKTYIEYAWRANESKIQAMGTGTTVKGIRLEDIRGLDIPLAPSAEQTRIAKQLDTLLARAHACIDRIDTIPALLKRFRQAVTNSACTGPLTADWRGSDSLNNWTSKTLDSVCNSITDGDHQAPKQVDSGIPFITISAINDGQLRLEKATRFVQQTYFNDLKSTRRPSRGDVLFSVTGSIGIPALVNTDAPFTFQRHIAILKPNTAVVLSSYLALVLGSDVIRRQVMAVATGTAQLTVPLGGLRGFVAILPPVREQAEIVRRVEDLFKLADRIEARYKAARAQAQRLTPLLLAKAFRGELVPQDLNDEPASVLLKRIAAERAAIAVQPRPRKSTAGRKLARIPKENAAMTKSRQDDDVQGQPYLTKHLRLLGGSAPAEALFKASELPVADFYKQLAWEVAQGHLRDGKTVLELTDAA